MRKALILLLAIAFVAATAYAKTDMGNKHNVSQLDQDMWRFNKVAYSIYQYEDLSVMNGGYGTGTLKVIIEQLPVTAGQIKDLSGLLYSQYDESGIHDLTIWFYSPSSDFEGSYNLAMTEYSRGEVDYDFKQDAMAGHPEYSVDFQAVCNRVAELYWQLHPEQDATYFNLLEADVYPAIAAEYGIKESEVKDIYLECSVLN